MPRPREGGTTRSLENREDAVAAHGVGFIALLLVPPGLSEERGLKGFRRKGISLSVGSGLALVRALLRGRERFGKVCEKLRETKGERHGVLGRAQGPGREDETIEPKLFVFCEDSPHLALEPLQIPLDDRQAQLALPKAREVVELHDVVRGSSRHVFDEAAHPRALERQVEGFAKNPVARVRGARQRVHPNVLEKVRPLEDAGGGILHRRSAKERKVRMHDVPALVKAVTVHEHGSERIAEVDRSQPDGLPVGGGTGRKPHR